MRETNTQGSIKIRLVVVYFLLGTVNRIMDIFMTLYKK